MVTSVWWLVSWWPGKQRLWSSDVTMNGGGGHGRITQQCQFVLNQHIHCCLLVNCIFQRNFCCFGTGWMGAHGTCSGGADPLQCVKQFSGGRTMFYRARTLSCTVIAYLIWYYDSWSLWIIFLNPVRDQFLTWPHIWWINVKNRTGIQLPSFYSCGQSVLTRPHVSHVT